MKVLVTGATGFIGSAFVKEALSRGHCIAALARQQSIPSNRPSQENLQWLPGTITAAPWTEIAEFAPEVCVHCAWTTAPKVPYDSPEHFRFGQESEGFFERLIRLGIKHVVGLGTCIEYRLGNQPLVEGKTPIGPVGPYAESKNNMRIWLEQAAERNAFLLSWARVFYVYGVGEDPSRLCTSLIRKFRRNEALSLKTPDSTKDYIYIDDVASALLLLLEKKFSGPINIGTGVGVTIRELAETTAGLLGKTGLVSTADAQAIDPLGYVVADSTRLRGLGWQPRYDLKAGLKRMVSSVSA